MKNEKTNRCDVLLIGYDEDEDNLGLRTIVAFLNKYGIQTKVEPFRLSLKEKILTRIRMERPKIVGFSLIFQRMLFEFAEMISYLRQNGINAHFTMGGHFPTLEYKEILDIIPGLDSVVRNEGEDTLRELFQNLNHPNSWKQIKGLVYREDKKINVNPPRPLIQDLDSLPYPERSDRITNHKGVRMCPMLASRGCYSNCSFCSIRTVYNTTQGAKRRTRSPSNVAQEMEQLFLERGIRIFTFKDDDLCTRGLQQRQWIDDFALELKSRKIADKIIWRVSCRVDEVDAEIMKMLREVGLAFLYMGIESGSNQGLKTLNKGFTVDDIFQALDILKELEISYEYGFMMLDPDSTITTAKENVDFLKKLGSRGEVAVHFTKMFPYAGAPITNRLKNEGRLKGTIAFPDYTYKDSKLDLLQLFFTNFYHRNFESNGLFSKLQAAKFDAIILGRFFSDKYDTHTYAETIKEITRQSNESFTETMSFAVNLMEDRSEKEILQNWEFLQQLAQMENMRELQFIRELDWIMACYNFNTTVS